LHVNVRDNSLLVDMLSSAVFLPRVSGRAAKRALKRLRLLVAGRNWAALNSSGSQLIGVRYVQLGLEERENLTVTWNVSIAIRSLCITLLAAILALVLVVTLAEDADARKVRRKKGRAEICAFIGCNTFQTAGQPFQLPNHFLCSPVAQPVTVHASRPSPAAPDGYGCTAVGSVGSTQLATFNLNDVLVRVTGPTADPPPGAGLEGVATPNLFECQWLPNAAGERLAKDFRCGFPPNQPTCVFIMNEIVATNNDDEDENGNLVGEVDLDRHADQSREDLFLPPACQAVPTAVPAGADVAGEGSAAWLFGLVLAAGGVTVGTAVIARRRFLHDS
jgi:hypothetical protein